MSAFTPKKCATHGCGTLADHPDSLTYLFKINGVDVDTCRWCRRGEDNKKAWPEPRIILALDLKLLGVAKPKEWQMTRATRKLLRSQEYRSWPPRKIFISDGDRIWSLGDFRQMEEGTDVDWDTWLALYPEWDMIEFVD